MANDLSLLLDPIVLQGAARPEAVIVTAKWVTMQRQVPSAVDLRLPHMGHFVNEKPLKANGCTAEILAIPRRLRVEMNVPARGHDNCCGLQGKPAPPFQRHTGCINCAAEHRPSQRGLSISQPARASDWTGMEALVFVQ